MATGSYINIHRHSHASSPPPASYYHNHNNRKRLIRLFYLAVFASISFLLYAFLGNTFFNHATLHHSHVPAHWNATRPPSSIRIAIATILYNNTNEINTRASSCTAHWGATKTLRRENGMDTHALSSDILFIRVTPLAIRLVTQALAAVYTEPPRDWGRDVTASSLQFILEKGEYRDKVLYQLASWFNGTAAVFRQVWAATPIERLLKISRILDSTSFHQSSQAPSPSPVGVEAFWTSVAEAKQVLNDARDRGHREEIGAFRDEVKAVREGVEMRAWDSEGLKWEVQRLKVLVGLVRSYG
ncbi:hypothetical protein CC86DRAFT_438858 [Ophiobolus disseminans]|uniref:Uncharacterized protein n=1 Tax=Ophiobolus disseminans TaxID=1469910 RepID=A0A6A7A5W2_9PLEO|nr:hypothetical protein CC86DRAFT_438858 [Ophiobolus disseminans]